MPLISSYEIIIIEDDDDVCSATTISSLDVGIFRWDSQLFILWVSVPRGLLFAYTCKYREIVLYIYGEIIAVRLSLCKI